ncbi:MAG TPA: penicillin acylase family protein [Gemmatimonadaceae bacterium]
MKTLAIIATVLVASSASAQAIRPSEIARWKLEAQRVQIIRDDWGIAHVYGHTDADAVFGMIYAQAEDDFNRVETNYLNSIGIAARAEGESAIYRDLRQKLFINTDTMKAMYARSPGWLKALTNAWADGLNYYLYTHPKVTPLAITRYEPWMPLTFSEGSIGGDIERVDLRQLEAFYGANPAAKVSAAVKSAGDELADAGVYVEPTGSNGIAIAPSNTVNHHALLLINPHTSFFFRSELQMVSDEGLDAYGAVTWGQFFIYQGWNPHLGWMHTSSGVDAVDEYLETISRKGDRLYYRYGGAEKPLRTEKVTIPYKLANGTMGSKTFTAYFTQHGPIVRDVNGKWVAFRIMNVPLRALQQSYLRTKATSYAAYLKTMDLHANSSNNTIYADAKGNIAYFHANYIPRRDTSFDWTRPVDGSDPRTEWGPLLSVDQTPHLLNPKSGWLYNSNNWPWSAAGPYSPKRADFPTYVEMGTAESARGYHALRVLDDHRDFTPERLRAAAYDSYLPAFARMLPPLIKAYDGLSSSDPLKARVAEQIDTLRTWDDRWAETSIPTSLAVFWGEDIGRRVARDARAAGESPEDYVHDGKASAQQLVEAVASASDRLTSDFGTWKTPWGAINRFQRVTGDIVQPFNDAGPSIPVGFTSSRWGSLASFGARPYPGTKKWYGTSGNSFVAVVEFGDSVRAIAITAGGESGHPGSPHFNDEAERYAKGDLRHVYFYRPDVVKHAERTYHPGA